MLGPFVPQHRELRRRQQTLPFLFVPVERFGGRCHIRSRSEQLLPILLKLGNRLGAGRRPGVPRECKHQWAR